MDLWHEDRLLIDGELVPAEGGATYASINPATGEEVASAADASLADTERAIAAARRAFDESDWARGDIRVDRVEVNQAVAIEVVRDGQLIPVDQRTGGLVKDRDTLIQVFWSIPGNWQARPITFKLHVRDIDGGLVLYEQTRMIAGPPSPGSTDGAMTFAFPADSFTGNLEFYVELWEGEGGHEGVPASSEAPAAPAGGMQPIGVTDEPMEAKVILVPVQYSYGNCNTDTTNVINNNYQAFYDWFFAQNPIHTLDLSIYQGAIELDTQLTTLSQINNRLVALRFNEFAEPNEYYHAVVNACAGGVDGAGGLAPGLPGPIKGAGDLRVSTTLWVDLGFTRDAFVHELGHNQGRPHSPCGDPDGADQSYPHNGSSIGAWGFDILTFQWRNPNQWKDYMSYCGPAWVSDWTWGHVHEQVRQLTSWDYAGAAPDGELSVEVLHGWVHPSGLEGWWTSPGQVPGEWIDERQRVRFYAGGGALIDERPAASWVLEDGKTRYFMVEVPDSDLSLVDAIERVSDDAIAALPRASVTRYFDAHGPTDD